MDSLMKHLIATAAALFVLCTASSADAGLMYGNRIANRLSTGTGRFARFYRYVGRMEYRKDVWLFGRPLGDPPIQVCPECGQPMSTHRHYYAQPTRPYSQPAQPVPAQPMPAASPTQQRTGFAVPPAPGSQP